MRKMRRRERSLRLRVGYATAAAGAAGLKEAAAEWAAAADGRSWLQPGGGAGTAPAPAPVSGDCAISCGLPDGRRALILSDGMGKGARAAAESRLVVKKLRKLLQEGLPAGQAIDRVNRYLLEKGPGSSEENRESFATVDLVLIDQHSGKASLYKMGAAPSFVVRGRKIRRMQRPGLPVGIVPAVKPGEASANLQPGDVIIMVSDGITDSDLESEDAWLVELLKKRDRNLGPRLLAEQILSEAMTRYGDRELDDATVIVAIVEE